MAQVFEKLEKEYKKCPDCRKILPVEQFEDETEAVAVYQEAKQKQEKQEFVKLNKNQ